MVQPSLPTAAAFVLIVLGVVAAFIYAVRWTGARRGDAPATVRRDTLRAAVGASLYLAATAGVAASGVLARDGVPPPLMVFLVGTNLVSIGVAFSRLGTRLVQGLPLVALVGVQAFRLPLELILHRWYEEGVLPITMTYAGRNFDIISGVLGLIVLLWAVRGTVPRAVVRLANLVGFALLLRVASIAVMSSPIPLRQYFEGPPVLLALHVPTVWIVPFCVGGALAAHLMTFRALRRRPA
ncbi:MAG: hypothetical protein AAGA54_17765 [Myxococcota bacterium]